jgi:hypothetical protein
MKNKEDRWIEILFLQPDECTTPRRFGAFTGGRAVMVFDESIADVAATIADALGPSTTKRAGSVEVAKGGGWQADLRRCGGPLLPPCATHREALDMKNAWLREHLVETAENTEFWRERRRRGRPKEYPTPIAAQRAKRMAQIDFRLRHYRSQWRDGTRALPPQERMSVTALRALMDRIITKAETKGCGTVKRAALDAFKAEIELELARLDTPPPEKRK